MNKTILLIARHGNTFKSGDIVKRVGITDVPLVESGLLQASKLGAYLQQNQLIPDVIFASQLKRTIQTAEQAQKMMNLDLPINSLSIFNEIDYGPDENQPEDNVLARIGQSALNDWEINAKAPEGWKVDPVDIISNWHHFSAQLKHDHEGKIILVITSNGIARFSPYLTGDFTTFSSLNSIKISTGSLCIFENAKSQYWTCTQWNLKL